MKVIFFIILCVQFAYTSQIDRSILSKYFASDFVVDIDRSYEFRQNSKVAIRHLPICKGAIISPTQVVTSADCLVSSIRTHKVEYRNITILHNSIRYFVDNIYEHNDFVDKRFSNNLTILELDKPITLNKYPSFVSSKNLDDIIENGEYVHLLFQNEYNGVIQSVKPISHRECKKALGVSSINDSILCFKAPSKVSICKSFQGSPITRVLDNGDIELLGIVPKFFINGCNNVGYFIAANVSRFQEFLDLVNDKAYVSEGPLTRGFIKTLPSGWHFLGTQESIDKDLAYILDYAKKIYLYDGGERVYKLWDRVDGVWSKEIFIPARSGFWLKK